MIHITFNSEYNVMKVLLNRGLMTKLKFLVLGIKIIIILLGLKHEIYAT